jgi:hypothetical protein
MNHQLTFMNQKGYKQNKTIYLNSSNFKNILKIEFYL